MQHVGELYERVTLESQSEMASSRSDRGSTAWATVATVWAKVTPISGREAMQAARVESIPKLRIKIRYRSDLTDAWRIGWQGQKYNILASRNPDRRKHYLEIDVEGATPS